MNRFTTTVRRLPRIPALLLVLTATIGLSACSSDDVTEIIVRHGPVPAPTLIAAGDGGSTVGDTRLFHFPAESDDGQEVLVDWIMTTTAVDAPAPKVESRINTGTFSFGDHNNQIVIEGVALYPGEGAVLEVADEVRRVVVGGSGRFAGVSGEIISVQADDGSWVHRFLLSN